VDPTDYVLSRPFDHASISGMFLDLRRKVFLANADVVGFPGLTIHSTGFVGIELLHVTKVVTLMGTGQSPHMPV
jgi:DNA replication regulator DPB11